MFNIDRYAYASGLNRIDPMEKLFFSLATMGVCLWADSVVVSVLVLLTMGFLSVWVGKTPLRVFFNLMLLPGSFLVLGVVSIALGISLDTKGFIGAWKIGQYYVGITQLGLEQSVHLFFRALGATGCLYFLSLNTPIVHLLTALRRLKCSKLLIELMSLIYRFIFVLIETADTMYLAQSARLGYAKISTGYRSLGALASTLFIRAYKRSEDLYTALESRGYEGELNVLEEEIPSKPLNYLYAGIYCTVLIVLVFMSQTWFGGLY